MSDQLAVTYRARNGRPPANLELQLSPSGETTVFLGTSFSLPGERSSRVGCFAGPAPEPLRAELLAYVERNDLLGRGGTFGQPSPSVPGRFAELKLGERTAEYKFAEMTAGMEIDRFERMLQGLSRAMLDYPRGAAEASLELERKGSNVEAAVVLTSIGSGPMDVLLHDPAEPLYTLFVGVELAGHMKMANGVTIPLDFGTGAMEPDTLSAMVEDGTLPTGITRLPPGMRLRFPTRALEVPAEAADVHATGRVEFWWPEGRARTSLIALTPDIEVI